MKKRDFLGRLTLTCFWLISKVQGISAPTVKAGAKSTGNNFLVDADLQKATILTPRQFGAVGDGIADDTLALRRMLEHPVDNDFVAYDFGSRAYRIATPLLGGDHASASVHVIGGYILQIGGNSGARKYKKMWLYGDAGDGGAKLITNQKLDHAMLAVILKGQSFFISGLTFQRDERCTRADTHFHGGPGVCICPDSGSTTIKEIVFSNCHFSNCHRAVEVVRKYYYPKTLVQEGTRFRQGDAGIIHLVQYKKCSFIYPYGSNSTNSASGDVATFQDNLVDTTKYTDCTFDGCVGGDCSVSPNRFSKDGCVFNSSYRLILEGKNNFKNGGVEMVAHFPTYSAFMIATGASSVPIPPTGSSVTIETFENLFKLGIKPGQRFYYESSGSWFYFIVQKIVTSNSMIIINDGTARPSPPGTIVHDTSVIFKDSLLDSRTCHIDGLHVSGQMLNYGNNAPGIYQVATPAIRVDDSNAMIENCLLNAPISMYSCTNLQNYPTTTMGEKANHVFKGKIANCIFQLVDAKKNATVLWEGASRAIASYNYDGLTIQNCNFHAPNSNCLGFVDLWSLRNLVTNCSFSSDKLIALISIKGFKNSFGVRIGNVGKDISQENAPRVENCTFRNIQKAITTSNGQANRASLGPGPSCENTNTFINIPQPYPEMLYNKEHVIGWEEYVS